MERDMFDTMTMTKLVGGFCGTFLVFLLGAWFAEEVYHSGGHKGEQAYVIEVADAGGEAEEAVEEIPFDVVFASASAEEGEGLWRACRSCHALEPGVNGTGPYLHGVVGRPVQSAEGYGAYSGALIEAADVWTPDNLNAFLENPRGYAPGTSMSYNGMRDVQDRANLIAYLATFN